MNLRGNLAASRSYLLWLLTIIAVFNTVDRVALGVLLQDIKAELDLSDTQLGLIGGIAFAFFYSLMGLPIARWADRGNRVTIIAITATLWGGAVALCGAATSFVQLMLFRMAVAVGEAGCLPPAFSLLADRFQRAERPRAIAIYGMAPPLGAVIGFFLAGALAETYGWRLPFVLLGIPSALLGFLTWATLRDPRQMQAAANKESVAPPIREVAQAIRRNRAFLHLLVGFAVMAFFSNGIFVWLPAFIMRSHDLQALDVGVWLALTWGVGGAAGAWVGGIIATRYARSDERRQLRLLALSVLVGGLLSTLAYLASGYVLAFVLIGLSTFSLAAVNGPLFSAFQTLMPARMRAVATALVYLVANLIGMGLGPLAAGVLSDALNPRFGEESLRYALLAFSPGYAIVALCLWHASKSILGDLADASDAITKPA